MQKVYLAGGMGSGWRDLILTSCRDFVFFNPIDKETGNSMPPQQYAIWDLHYVRQADILFCYMERTNPSGIGLACEMGFAFGIGKTVILVLEKNNEYIPDESLAFLSQLAQITFDNFSDGMEYLTTFSLGSTKQRDEYSRKP